MGESRPEFFLMTIAIKGIGLATAQGNVADILESSSLRSASALPWTPSKWNISRVCYPAVGVESSLWGVERWQALAKKALNDVGASGETPLLVASCNGSAGERWEDAFANLLANTDLPVFSSSCASGIHALYAARELLMSGAVEEVLVLAADILARSNHENFESLRVLAERPQVPWQSTNTGFILGEAAVVLRLTRAQGDAEQTTLHGPELASDLVEHDGLSNVIEALSPVDPALIFGQGTGPYATDTAELRALATFIDKQVPIATPLTNYGHTLGASSLLSIALGAVIPGQTVLATCRALNGACAATSVGRIAHAKTQRRKGGWERSTIPGPLMNPTIKRLAEEAYEQQPAEPPDLLILRLEKPLAPQPEAIIGGRLLPSAVLEITPGFASQLIARCWGYSGPALCLVGNVDIDPYGLTEALRESGANVFQVNLRGSGDNRAIEWNV